MKPTHLQRVSLAWEARFCPFSAHCGTDAVFTILYVFALVSVFKLSSN